jgi:hypothetical protein
MFYIENKTLTHLYGYDLWNRILQFPEYSSHEFRQKNDDILCLSTIYVTFHWLELLNNPLLQA